LLLVQQQLAAVLEQAAAGPIRILSICAGDGCDVVGVLAHCRRRADVCAMLVEQNLSTIARGEYLVREAGLGSNVIFFQADATDYATYRGAPAADIVLLCGVWGHVPPQERGQLVHALSGLCATSGYVIWTRGIARGMSRLRDIQTHFMLPAWEIDRIDLAPKHDWAVATYCHRGLPQELPDRGRIFHFRPGAGTRS
jgi:Putative methyltransferase